MQSPEQIAKDYGGNKQKIAEAMQMGVLDRMRSAAQQEAAPQQSVAQQVFAPPAPPPMAAPAGLGATPEAAAMPPMNAAPPMGAAPPQEMPAMAEGGMVPPYASGGGLSDIPVPDGMFDEPSNGGFGDGYAGGGMVAFLEGGPVKEKTPEEIAKEEEEKAYLARLDSEPKPPANAANEIVVSGQGPAKAPIPLKIPEFSGIPTAMYGMTGTSKDNLAALKEMAPQQTKYSERLTKELEKSLDAKEQKNRARENLDMAMIRAGVAMANAPGSILQAATAGIGAGLPGFEAGVKEQRAEVRDAVKSLAEQEGVSNKAAREAANLAMEMTMKYGTLAEAMKDRAVQIMLAERSDAVQLLIARMSNATQRAGQLVSLQAAKVAAYAPTGTERIVDRASRDTTYANTLSTLGVFGGASTGTPTSNANPWGTATVVTQK